MILPARPAHFLLGRLVVSQVLQYNHLGIMPLREFVTPCILFLLPEIVGASAPTSAASSRPSISRLTTDLFGMPQDNSTRKILDFWSW